MSMSDTEYTNAINKIYEYQGKEIIDEPVTEPGTGETKEEPTTEPSTDEEEEAKEMHSKEEEVLNKLSITRDL